MPGELFYWVLNMSISTAFAGIIVLLLCKIKRLPRRIACFLWIIPYIRMTVPFGMGSRFSLMTLISKFTTRTVRFLVFRRVGRSVDNKSHNGGK